MQLRASGRPQILRQGAPRRQAVRCKAAYNTPLSAAQSTARQDLGEALARLPGLAGVLPGAGDETAKQRVITLIGDLERSAPFRPQAPGAAQSLVGDWELVFASQGTVVTRSPPAQALAALQQAAGSLPGVGLRDIRQQLTTPAADTEAGSTTSPAGSSSSSSAAAAAAAGAGVSCSNAVSIGLGPFGTWEVRVLGHWFTTHEPAWRFSGGSPRRASNGAASTTTGSNGFGSSGASSGAGSGSDDAASEAGLASEVSFDGVGVRLQGFFGLDLGKAFPELKLQMPRRAPSTRPNWETTYCDGEWRVGRGVESGGLFLFRKKP